MESLKGFTEPWFIWAMIGLVLVLAEFGMPGLIVIFFGVGALVVALLMAFIPMPFVMQLIVFLATSVGLLVGLRRCLKRIFTGRRRNGVEQNSVASDFIGEIAVVVRVIPVVGEGRVELHGTQWDAEAGCMIDAGTRVVVTGQSGSVMKVKKSD
jgi:membrane protein implicated in regulation of membrane protease activity